MRHLIPQAWFVDLHWLLLLAIGGVALYVLIKGADLLVEGASGIALRLGISKIIVGATIVSLGTTSPEAAVSVMAAIQGDPGLTLGNAVGSVIADTGLIFGTVCLLMPLPVNRFLLNRQGWVQIGSAVLLAIFSYFVWIYPYGADTLGRWVGIVFLMLLAWYLWASIKWGGEHARRQRDRIAAQSKPTEDGEAKVLEKAEHDPWPKLILSFFIGLAMVIVCARVVIACAKEGAEQAGIPQVVIAGTIVALGTSLPELMVGVSAIRKGHASILIGNVVGADILNILFVIGASATATPLNLLNDKAQISEIFLYLHLPTMLLILLVFRICIYDAIRNGKFRRWHGIPLVIIYLTYIIFNILLAK